MGAISYLSSFDTHTPSHVPLLGLHGPRNDLKFGWDALAVALFSILASTRWPLPLVPARTHQALEYIGDLTAEAEEEEAVLATP